MSDEEYIQLSSNPDEQSDLVVEEVRRVALSLCKGTAKKVTVKVLENISFQTAIKAFGHAGQFRRVGGCAWPSMRVELETVTDVRRLMRWEVHPPRPSACTLL